MTDSEPINFDDSRTVPIPPLFHSLEQDGPFDSCLRCARPLLLADEPYMIERVFKRDEPIIEYAMCLKCAESSNSELSTESKHAIREWFQQRLDPMSRFEQLVEANEADDGMPLYDQCVITGKSASDCEERQVMAMCRGDQMILGLSSPMMLSGAATEEIVELLSEQTKGWLQDFVGDSFGMPPEFCDNPDIMPLLI